MLTLQPVSKRIASLDGLRGIAILLVVVSHVPGSGFAQFGGAVGVQLFFVLSGFLITRLLIEEVDRTGRISLGRFWTRRAARLLPAIAVMIIGFIPVAAQLGAVSEWVRITLLGATYLASFIRSSGGSLGVVDHMWSLAVEEWFYLLWPIVLLVTYAKRRDAGRILAALAAAAVLWKIYLNISFEYERSYFSIDGNAFALLGGATTAAIAARFRQVPSRPALHIGVACIVVFGLAPDLPDNGAAILWGVLFLMPVSAVTVWHASGGSPLLDHSALRWFGRISYSLYLWHLPLLEVPILLGLSPWTRAMLLLPAAVLLAAISTLVIEEPIVAKLKMRQAESDGSTAICPS